MDEVAFTKYEVMHRDEALAILNGDLPDEEKRMAVLGDRFLTESTQARVAIELIRKFTKTVKGASAQLDTLLGVIDGTLDGDSAEAQCAGAFAIAALKHAQDEEDRDARKKAEHEAIAVRFLKAIFKYSQEKQPA